jgi:hypothetical protein
MGLGRTSFGFERRAMKIKDSYDEVLETFKITRDQPNSYVGTWSDTQQAPYDTIDVFQPAVYHSFAESGPGRCNYDCVGAFQWAWDFGTHKAFTAQHYPTAADTNVHRSGT